MVVQRPRWDQCNRLLASRPLRVGVARMAMEWAWRASRRRIWCYELPHNFQRHNTHTHALLTIVFDQLLINTSTTIYHGICISSGSPPTLALPTLDVCGSPKHALALTPFKHGRNKRKRHQSLFRTRHGRFHSRFWDDMAFSFEHGRPHRIGDDPEKYPRGGSFCFHSWSCEGLSFRLLPADCCAHEPWLFLFLFLFLFPLDISI